MQEIRCLVSSYSNLWVPIMAPTETKNIRYSHFFQLFVFREEWGTEKRKINFCLFFGDFKLKSRDFPNFFPNFFIKIIGIFF